MLVGEAQIYTTTWLSRGQKFAERHGHLQGNLQPFALEVCLFHLISCRNKIRSRSLMPKVVYLSHKLILQTEEHPAASRCEFVIYSRPSASSSFSSLLTTSTAACSSSPQLTGAGAHPRETPWPLQRGRQSPAATFLQHLRHVEKEMGKKEKKEGLKKSSFPAR